MRYMVIICLIILFMSAVVCCTHTSYAQQRDACVSLTPSPTNSDTTSTASITVTPTSTNPLTSFILFNEIDPPASLHEQCGTSATKTSTDQGGWIELYNTTSASIDPYMQNCDIDSGDNTTPFYIAMNSAIPAHDFLVLDPYSTYYFISTLTSTLRLLCNGVIMDQVIVPPLPQGTSYARSKDGGDTWEITNNITMGTSNNPATPTPPPTIQTTPLPQTTTQVQTGKQTGNLSIGQPSSTDTPSRGEIISPSQPSPYTQQDWKTFQCPTAKAQPSQPLNSVSITPQTTSKSPATSNPGNLLREITLTLILIIGGGVLWLWRNSIRTFIDNSKITVLWKRNKPHSST